MVSDFFIYFYKCSLDFSIVALKSPAWSENRPQSFCQWTGWFSTVSM